MAKEKTTAKKTKTTKKLTSTDLNLFVYNDNCDLEIVKVPIKYKNEFIARFGVMSPPNKQTLVDWLENIKNKL